MQIEQKNVKPMPESIPETCCALWLPPEVIGGEGCVYVKYEDISDETALTLMAEGCRRVLIARLSDTLERPGFYIQ